MIPMPKKNKTTELLQDVMYRMYCITTLENIAVWQQKSSGIKYRFKKKKKREPGHTLD